MKLNIFWTYISLLTQIIQYKTLCLDFFPWRVLCVHIGLKKTPNLCTGDRSSPRAALSGPHDQTELLFGRSMIRCVYRLNWCFRFGHWKFRRCRISVVITRFSLFDFRHVSFRGQWSILIDNWNTLGLFSIHFSDRK